MTTAEKIEAYNQRRFFSFLKTVNNRDFSEKKHETRLLVFFAKGNPPFNTWLRDS